MSAYRKGGLLAALALCAGCVTAAPLKTRDVIELWPGVAPGSETSSATLTVTERSKVPYWPDRALTGVTRPSLTAFVPDKPNGTVVIVAPGGAYTRIAIDKESSEMARWLNPQGVTVLLLQYRLPGEGHQNSMDVPLQDAQRAMRVIRANAGEWKLDTARVGAIGMSAGGSLAATLGTQYAKASYAPRDAVDRLSARPDFLGLLYPVVSMTDALTHAQSRELLLGSATPSAALIAEFSAEQHVSKDTPPTFLACANDDGSVPPENSVAFYRALRAAGVPAELHVFRVSGHGFGIRGAKEAAAEWPNLFMAWMGANAMLP